MKMPVPKRGKKRNEIEISKMLRRVIEENERDETDESENNERIRNTIY